MKHLFPLFSSFFAACLFTACGSDYIYEKSYEMPASGWEYQDTLDFDFTITDTLQIYNLLLEIDHTTDYRFQNLYIKIYTLFPSGERIGGPLSLELSDKAGVWQGRCDAEDCSLEIPIQEGAFFNRPGQYKITLEQYMREEPLPGIKGFTFRVEKTDQRREK